MKNSGSASIDRWARLAGKNVACQKGTFENLRPPQNMYEGGTRVGRWALRWFPATHYIRNKRTAGVVARSGGAIIRIAVMPVIKRT